MSQKYFMQAEGGWWCTLCPANHQTHPHQTAETHFETMHTVEELYDPNRKLFRGTWPQTKEELIIELTDNINNVLECGCLVLMSAEDCGGQLDCGSGRKRGTHPCDCKCHRIFDTIEKIEKKL